MAITKTKFYSWKIGTLPKGCKLCVQGRKTVLFVTGLCSTRCFYCPISDIKMNKDVIYANERPVKDVKQVIEEIKLCNSHGAGITGGDPLVRIDRTVQYIRAMKKAFGRKFHTHLYTPLTLVNGKSLEKLYRAGLDELRFHPSLYSRKEWHKIELAQNFAWDIGVEIPALPGKEEMARKLIDYVAALNDNAASPAAAKLRLVDFSSPHLAREAQAASNRGRRQGLEACGGNKIAFLNINELEISDSNANKLLEHSFVPKDRISYGVRGSQELALKLLKYAQSKIKNVHYCTTTLKDRVQLANRIKLRARNVAEKYDRVTGEGILIRGAVYLPELKPGFGYRKKVAEIKSKTQIIRKLEKIRQELKKKHKINSSMIKVDGRRLRILTSEAIARKIKEKNLVTAIVKEYPTYDQFEVEIDFL